MVANATVSLTGGRARIEIAGQVPNQVVREAVLRLAHDEAARIRGDFERLAVVPSLERRAVGAGRVATWRRMLYYERFAVGEVAESAEGSRLLSGYRGKASVQGSNPCLSATRP